MARLQRVMKLLATYIFRRFWLFFAVFLLSLHQATILAYGDFGTEAVLANLDRLNDIQVLKALIISYLGQLELAKIVSKVAGYTILLFFIQSIPVFIYGCFKSIKSRRRAALVIRLLPATVWFLPALLGLPETLIGTALYLFSPIYAIATFPGFMFATQSFNKEDFAEGWAFMLAVVGWFHLFWLSVTVKVWVFPNYQFNRTMRSHFSD